MKYENLEHTADLKLRAYGKTIEEVFGNMALGMFESTIEPQAIDRTQPFKIEIKVKAKDSAELLIDFLNQLVYLSDINSVIFTDFGLVVLEKNRDWLVEGVISGFKVFGYATEIKAATYSELKLEEDQEGNWVAEVVFDI